MDEVYEGYIESDAFDLDQTIPYFKEPIIYTASKYEPIIDMFFDIYKYLSKEKQKIYSRFLWSIVAHLTLVEKNKIKDDLEKSGKCDLVRLEKYFAPDMESDIEIKYITDND